MELSDVKEKHNKEIEILNNKYNKVVEQKQQLEFTSNELNEKLKIYENTNSNKIIKLKK